MAALLVPTVALRAATACAEERTATGAAGAGHGTDAHHEETPVPEHERCAPVVIDCCQALMSCGPSLPADDRGSLDLFETPRSRTLAARPDRLISLVLSPDPPPPKP
jgi:hypothetical protein